MTQIKASRSPAPEQLSRVHAQRQQHHQNKQQDTNIPIRSQPSSSDAVTTTMTVDERPPKTDSYIISTDLLIPGKGDPIKHASVIIQDKIITWVGQSKILPPAFENLPTTHVPVLMPGLWDCHLHLMGLTSFSFSDLVTTSPALQGARLTRGCHDLLMSGFTSVRDLGGHACEVSKAIEEGTIIGPNIYSAGSALSQTAGHGDIFDIPVSWAYQAGKDVQGRGQGETGLMLCDGIEECRKAVRLQVRRGAKVIKVLASGGVLSLNDDPMLQQFSDEELKIIVSEAARMKRIVAAHVHGKEGILAAIRCGCKTLEHGTYLDQECIDAMKEKEVMLVATRTVVMEGIKHPELMDPRSYEKMKETAKNHKAAYALAISSGIKCALGTDSGISTPGTGLSHGSGGGEVSHAVEAGMTPLEAIEAATANGPLTLGPQAPKSGQIIVGFDADLIGLRKNPLENVKLFREWDAITHVWKGGKCFKWPGKGSSFV